MIINNNINNKDHKPNIVQTVGFNWCCRVEGQCSVMDLTIFSAGMRGNGMKGKGCHVGKLGALRGIIGCKGPQSHTQAHSYTPVRKCMKLPLSLAPSEQYLSLNKQTLYCTQNTPILYICKSIYKCYIRCMLVVALS